VTSREHPGAGGPEQDRLDNGLHAPAYVPLTDVDPDVGQHLLSALGRARIPAYLGPAPELSARRRLFVASDDRVVTRTIVAERLVALGAEQPDGGVVASGVKPGERVVAPVGAGVRDGVLVR